VDRHADRGARVVLEDRQQVLAREIATAVVGSTVTIVAERRSLANRASSPTMPPWPTCASVIGEPSTSRRVSFTSPLSIT
jgi:hypothetical protein